MQIQFEAGSIQSWITAGNKLIDISGGSEILEYLVSKDVVNTAINQALLVESQLLVNAASRILIDCSDELSCRRFCQLWALVVRGMAPEMTYTLRIVVPDEKGSGRPPEVKADFSRQGPGFMFSPLIRRAARTGGAVVFDDTAEDLDRSSLFRRKVGTSISIKGSTSILLGKLNDPKKYDLQFIKDTDELAEAKGRRTLAYVHADTSGLGWVFHTLEQWAGSEAARQFSHDLDQATVASVKDGLAECAKHPDTDGTLSVRPVLVGGDDVTLILHGMYAFAFAVAFMRTFDKRSERIMSNYRGRPGLSGLPKRLSVGCGIAFVHPHFPAGTAIELAESLCSWAKKGVGRGTSALAFHRVTGSTVDDDYGDIFEREFARSDHRLTGGPYLLRRPVHPDDLQTGGKGVKEEMRGPLFEALQNFLTVGDLGQLVDHLSSPKIPTGPQKEMLALAYGDPTQADDRLEQLIQVARDDRNSAYAKHVTEMLKRTMLGGDPASIWFERPEVRQEGSDYIIGGIGQATPLADAHALISVANRPGRRSEPISIGEEILS